MDLLRGFAPPLLALVTVIWIDSSTRRRGLLPPGFQISPTGDSRQALTSLARRTISMILLWSVLWIGVFLPLGSVGREQEIDFSLLSGVDLFTLHLMLVICVGVWYLAGFVPAQPGTERSRTGGWGAQLGFRTDSVAREIGLGLVAGVGAWLMVIGVLLAVALVVWWLGGEELLPQEPPALIPWIAGLPILLRIGISLSAGFVEEMFFRGFLQPRVGLALSTALFVLAHASYEQPLMLLGVGILSVIYGLLVRWRQNIWPAIAAHALFDAVQLLVVIPAALKVLPEEGIAEMVSVIFGLC